MLARWQSITLDWASPMFAFGVFLDRMHSTKLAWWKRSSRSPGPVVSMVDCSVLSSTFFTTFIFWS